MKHDENKDLRSFSRIGKVNIGDKTLRASKASIIGIRMWGKIDYLTKYCGWHFIWDNSAGVGKAQIEVKSHDEKKSKKDSKPVAKVKKLPKKN